MNVKDRLFNVGCLLVAVTVTSVHCCDVTAIVQDIGNCVSVPTTTSAASIVSAFCDSIECNIQCYIDAVGSCYTQAAFFTLEPNIIKVSSRAICDNKDVFLSSITECTDAFLTTCFTDLTTAIVAAATDYTNGDYAAYKTAMCSAANTFISCFTVTTTQTCTAEKATFLEDYLKAASSYSECGSSQNDVFFITYGDDVTCGTSHVLMTYLPVMMAVVGAFFGVL